MRFLVILVVVACTGAAGYLYGTTVLGRSTRQFSVAGQVLLECVWSGLVCFSINLAVAFVAILVLRAVMGDFMSLYVVSDVTLLILSLLQGAMFRLWRRETARHAGMGRTP